MGRRGQPEHSFTPEGADAVLAQRPGGTVTSQTRKLWIAWLEGANEFVLAAGRSFARDPARRSRAKANPQRFAKMSVTELATSAQYFENWLQGWNRHGTRRAGSNSVYSLFRRS